MPKYGYAKDLPSPDAGGKTQKKRIEEDKIINQISAITEKVKGTPTVVFI